MNDYEKEINQALVGKTIKAVKWLDPDNSFKVFGWDRQPCEIHLDDGTILTPSADDEGNDAGVLFTNLRKFQVLPVNREPVSEKAFKEQERRIQMVLNESKRKKLGIQK